MNDLAQTNETLPQHSDNSIASVLHVIERAASDPNIDVQKMEKLLDMQERIIDKQAQHAFSQAMVNARRRMKPVITDAYNPQTKSRYSSFEALDKACSPIYTEAGFNLSFYEADCPKDGHVRVCVDIDHEQGHSRTRHVDIPVVTTGIQGKAMMTQTHATASAFSYGMRYLFRMIWSLSMTESDDDGNRAGAKTINENQIADLNAKMDEANDPQKLHDKIKANYNVENIGQITADKFGEVINRCNQFIRNGG